jgi:AAA ATPase domain
MADRVTTGRFVGRTQELARLHQLLARAGDGEPLVVVGGEAGVGKTRLVEQLAAGAAGQGVRVLGGGCVPLGEEGLPFAPLVEALRGLADQLTRPSWQAVAGPAGPTRPLARAQQSGPAGPSPSTPSPSPPQPTKPPSPSRPSPKPGSEETQGGAVGLPARPRDRDRAPDGRGRRAGRPVAHPSVLRAHTAPATRNARRRDGCHRGSGEQAHRSLRTGRLAAVSCVR